VNSATRFLSPSQAARQLGISTKALRIYERRGLITPGRTSAGWRAYGPVEMARAADIVELRALGLSLREVTRVLEGDAQILDRTLAVHTAALEDRVRQLGDTISKVSRLRADLGGGDVPAARELARLLKPAHGISVAFDLPWPWGGERFELRDIRSLNYIVGPLGSGKTQLAKRLAGSLPNATFVGLDRLANGGATAQASLDADPALKSRVEKNMAVIVDDGGTGSAALLALLTALQSETSSILVIDMLEQGLDEGTQEALINSLRRRGPTARPLFFLTRSSAILDLDCVGADEAIILCPANHCPPSRVIPCPGSPGYEAVATCLASPEVRARTDGMIAQWPTKSVTPVPVTNRSALAE
jgi:DNA-binding transcriptional MerR regulator